MKLWLIYFESANYCGAGEYCVVVANSKDEAIEAASYFMEDYCREQDYYDYVVDYGESEADEATWSVVVDVGPFDANHELWKDYIDPAKNSYFHKID